jgi:reactive intermediate/imine deaminase
METREDLNPPVYVNATELAAPAGHYSHAVVANGLVFVSGQLPIARDGSRLVDAPFDRQVEQVLDNLAGVLAAAGSARDRLVQVRVYVDDITNWPSFDSIYAHWAGAARPARAVVPTGALHHGLKLEIEAVALVAG